MTDPASDCRFDDLPSKRNRWRLLGLKFTLLILTLSFSFLLAEIAYRILLNARYRYEVAHYANGTWVPVPTGEVYRLKPGAVGEVALPENPKIFWRYKINAQGFRGGTLGPKNASIKRMIFLGDSYAFGWGLSEDQLPFPAITEHLMNKDEPTTTTEVLNAAIPGYNTQQELALLEEIGPQYKPDTVVLTYVMNDSEPVAQTLNVPIPPRLIFQHCRSWILADVVEIMNAKILHRPLFRTCKNKYDFNYANGFRADSSKWRDTQHALQAMADFCDRRGMHLLLVILPDTSRTLDHSYPYASIHQTVADWARHASFDVLDLLPAFMNSGQKYRMQGDGHPNAEAHRKMAELISSRLKVAETQHSRSGK